MPKVLSDQEIAEFRERLCDAAERLFAKYGPEVVTMRQMTLELGVSQMTPYRYFKDKDAILAAVRARGFRRLGDAMEIAYAESSGDLAVRANAAGRGYVQFAFDNPQTYKLMFDFSQPNENDYPELVAAAERARAHMTQHLRELIAQGRVRGEPEFLGHLYWSAMHGPIMLHLSQKLMPGCDAGKLIDTLVEVLNSHFIPLS